MAGRCIRRWLGRDEPTAPDSRERVDFFPSQWTPHLLPDEVVELAEAKLMAHGSKEVRALLNHWLERLREFGSLGAALDAARINSTQDKDPAAKASVELEKVRSELIGGHTRLGGILGETATRIRKELGYKDDE